MIGNVCRRLHLLCMCVEETLYASVDIFNFIIKFSAGKPTGLPVGISEVQAILFTSCVHGGKPPLIIFKFPAQNLLRVCMEETLHVSVDIFLVGIADQLSFLWMYTVHLCSVSLDVVWSFLTGSDSYVRMRRMFIIAQL